MLVSLMARMLAISQMHDSQYAMMRNNMATMSMIRNMPSFMGNPNSMAMLHEADKRLALSNAQNQTLYMIAQAQEEAAAKRLQQEYKSNQNRLSYIA